MPSPPPPGRAPTWPLQELIPLPPLDAPSKLLANNIVQGALAGATLVGQGLQVDDEDGRSFEQVSGGAGGGCGTGCSATVGEERDRDRPGVTGVSAANPKPARSGGNVRYTIAHAHCTLYTVRMRTHARTQVIDVGGQLDSSLIAAAAADAGRGPFSLDHLTVAELKTELKKRGLPAMGNRRELITRLQEAGVL